MNLLVHFLTSAAILLHALVGCCAHRGHSASAGHTHGGVTACHAVHHHHHHSHQDATESGAAGEEEQESPHVCEHARCAWHVQETWEVDVLGPGGEWVDSPDAYFLLAMAVDKHSQLPSRWQCSKIAALPVRSHLAKCVMVV